MKIVPLSTIKFKPVLIKLGSLVLSTNQEVAGGFHNFGTAGGAEGKLAAKPSHALLFRSLPHE